MDSQLQNVGAPDPKLKTSPIIDENEALSLDAELETPGCYFNDVVYPIGECVSSGSEVLCCVERGIWIRKGESRP
jgi:hypothetical protein